jgi:hypothetical protein
LTSAPRAYARRQEHSDELARIRNPVDNEPVVTTGQRPLNGAGLLDGKPVGVLLVRVNQDL